MRWRFTRQLPTGLLQARGLVESWLGAVEAGMRNSLKSEARRCMREYAQLPGIALIPSGGEAAAAALGVQAEASSGLEAGWVGSSESQGQLGGGAQAEKDESFTIDGLWRGQWALLQPAQRAVVVWTVFWCQAVEAALEAAAAGGGGAAAALAALERVCGDQLEDLIRLVRGGLTELQRRVRAQGLPAARWLLLLGLGHP